MVVVITDNAKLAQGIDPEPLIIPNNGPLTALIAALPLQVIPRVNIFLESLESYFCLVNRI